MTHRPIQRVVAAAIVAGLVAIVAPTAAVACDCSVMGSLAEVRDEPGTVVFTGITEARDDRGYPVTVTRWFQGDGLAPRVWMTASTFDGNGASCGIEPLPVGGEWIFVAYRTPGDDHLIVNLCAPHHALAEPAGQAMLADAMATFGGPRTAPPTLPPSGPAGTGTGDSVAAIVPAIAVTVIAVLAMVFGVWSITDRRRSPSDVEVDDLR